MVDRTYSILLTCLVLTLVSLTLPAAELVTTPWSSRELGLEMQLRPDGSYRFSGPGGSSTGSYQINGQFLLMQDGRTGQQSIYGLSQPSADTLTLTDPSGASIRMQAGKDRTAQASQAPPMAQVLAESQGMKLTGGEMQVGYDLVELIIDERLTEPEKKRLIEASIKEFSAQPTAFLAQVNSLRSSIQRVQSLQNPFMLGLARQMLFAQFYLVTEALPEEQMPEVIRVMREHLRVVAIDRENQLLLTDRDIDAMIAYNQFMSELAGLQATPVNREMFEQQIQQSFLALPLETRQTLAAIYPVWQATRYSWAQMNPQQQQQVIAGLRRQNTATGTSNQYFKPEPNSEWGKTSSGRMALEMMRSANNARIMSSMIDTTAGFTACLSCSPGINPFK